MMKHTRRQFLAGMAALVAGARVGIAQTVETRVRTIAGTGVAGYVPEGPDGSVAISAPITNPYGIVAGPDGALYFCEVDTGRTRRLDPAGRLTTIAGDGLKRFAGDGSAALGASFSAPHEIRFDVDGNLFVVERDAHVVRRIDRRSGLVTTIAGTGVAGYSGDGGPAARAQLRQPHSIAFDASGNLLICDIGNNRVRLVERTNGLIRTFAGTGERSPTPDEGPIEGTPLQGPRSIDTDDSGIIYLVLREGNAVFRLDPRTSRLQRIAGTGETGFTGDGGLASQATFNGPKGIAYASADRCLYIVDTENHVIRKVDLGSGIVTTVLGTGARGDGPDGDPRRCALARPHGVFMHLGVLYVTDSENHRIRALETIG
jgi:sugar lactone lactonase YvrE